METVLVAGLAGLSLGTLLSNEELSGPWNSLHKLRYLIGVRYDQASHAYGTNEIAKAILCPYCCTFWTATFFYLLLIALPQLWPLAGTFAAIGVAFAVVSLAEV